jgi:hypothetical protein
MFTALGVGFGRERDTREREGAKRLHLPFALHYHHKHQAM